MPEAEVDRIRDIGSYLGKRVYKCGVMFIDFRVFGLDRFVESIMGYL
jgi:hypothetical protein